jgi:hypothetical protein
VGLRLAKQVIAKAEEQGIPCCLAGGIAIHLYGFLRATKDVDLIARDEVIGPFPFKRPLSFGGSAFTATVKKWGKVDVDVIVRRDEQQRLYEDASQSPVYINKMPVVSPEHLVIIKFLAGRAKDLLDFQHLVTAPRLVDMKLLRRMIKRLFANQWYLAEEIEAAIVEAKWRKSIEKGK